MKYSTLKNFIIAVYPPKMWCYTSKMQFISLLTANLILYYLFSFKSASILKQKLQFRCLYKCNRPFRRDSWINKNLNYWINLVGYASEAYSLKTEKSYVLWVRRFIFFHKRRHPQEMGAPDIQSFLNYLTVDQHVAASTQNQALIYAAPGWRVKKWAY